MSKNDDMKERMDKFKQEKEAIRLSQIPKKIEKSSALELKESREEMEKLFKQYHALCLSKVVEANKSAKEKEIEKAIVNQLLAASNKLETLNPGEGTGSVNIILLRELLVYRNRINELEHAIKNLQKDEKSAKIVDETQQG